MSTPNRKTLSTGQIAALLEVDGKTVHNWVDAGRLKATSHTLGGQLRFDPEDVRARYVADGLTLPAPFVAYLERGELPPEPTQRTIARISTKRLRAELERREKVAAKPRAETRGAA